VPFCLGFFIGKMAEENEKLKSWVVVGFIGIQVGFMVGALLLVGWEVLEQRDLFESIGMVGESTTNMVGDLIIGSFAMIWGMVKGG